jgi:hypothetical protein
MGFLVVLLLTAVWASILLPGIYRAHQEASGINSIRSFERTMNMLARKCGSARQVDPCPPGRRVLVLDEAARVAESAARSRMRRRQRAALARLGSTVFGTGVLAILVGDLLWTVFGLSVVVFTVYAFLVAQVRAHDAERYEKVRDIKPARQSTSATRSGTGSSIHIRRGVG